MKPFDSSAKVGIISLGCPRNLVDSEVLIGILNKKGFEIAELREADIGIINTCAFIDEAKQESISMILKLTSLKKEGKLDAVVVAGCLPQRYGKSLAEELPEVDAFIGCGDIEKIGDILGKLGKKETAYEVSETPSFIYSHTHPRIQITPPHYAYIKISEGCKNRCSFCIIPSIKGNYRSRPIESVLKEAGDISKKTHLSEINIVGQDTTLYGGDIYGKFRITELLRKLCSFKEYKQWIRLLYTYPAHIEDDLIGLFAAEKSLCKYMDLPIQHINDRILKMMNRPATKRDISGLIAKIRKRIQGVALRSSVIVGFPGETDKEFDELADFIKEIKFERLGVFTYSQEEGTPAFNYSGQVDEKTKLERFNVLMAAQKDIAENINKLFLGRTIEVLIDEKDDSAENLYVGRTEADAPEVDGEVFVKGIGLKPGDFVNVRIIDTLEYDLVGEVL